MPGKPYLPVHHPRSKFKWNAPKTNGTSEEKMDVVITEKAINDDIPSTSNSIVT